MAKQTPEEKDTAAGHELKPHCGIIMPISDSPGYDPGHWVEVRRLIVRAAEQAGYTAAMVSENDGQDIIHRSIIKNIYHNDLVVCDVSSLNPNVMLELGLRMANKKPLVVVFDGEVKYPFDIGNMLYVSYPKGLHHFKVEAFVQDLTARINQVTEAAKANKYEPFLNHFNDVVIERSELDVTTQGLTETLADLVDEVKSIRSEIKGTVTNARVVNGVVGVKSSIFNTQEIDYMQSVSRDSYLTHRSLSTEALVDLTYSNLVNSLSNKALPVYDSELVQKIEHYQKTARNIIRTALLDFFAAGLV